MIKDFSTYIGEGRMGRLVNADVLGDRKQDKLTEDEVMGYIEADDRRTCKKVIIRYEGDKPIVDIVGDFVFREDITEIPFQFGQVSGCFTVSQCKNLKSLEGSPKEVGENFCCHVCNSLESLAGCPEYVGGSFFCCDCPKLTSLEGCPKEVGYDFVCNNCGELFTKEYVRSLCNVKRKIEVL